MNQSHMVTAQIIASEIAQSGFLFVHGEDARQLLTATQANALADWEHFSSSWDDLGRDDYMADGGHYRLRRHAVMSAASDGLPVPEPRRPHYQSRAYNHLNGGVARWFEPIAPSLLSGSTMKALVGLGLSIFRRLRGGVNWEIELHQIRIQAAVGAPGYPTPEGAHRDGVYGVLVALIRRENIRSGTTTLYTPAGRPISSFTLSHPLDMVLLEDERLFHGVTPIEPIEHMQSAIRDVLIITFQSQAGRRSK